MKTVEVPEASPKLASLLAQAGDEDLVVKPPDGREFLLLAIDEFDIEITRTRANTRIMELLDARAGSTAALPLAPVISAPASPDSKDSLSRGRVRKPDSSDPLVVARPVGQAHSPAGMTVGTPGTVLDQASPMAPVLINGIRSVCPFHRDSPPIALGAGRSALPLSLAMSSQPSA
jgi:hypothetical protein